MAVTVAEIQTRILATVQTEPYTADSSFGTRMTSLVTEMFAHILDNFGWWYARQGKTVTSGSLEAELAAIGYHGSAMVCYADMGNSEQAEIHKGVYEMLSRQFRESYAFSLTQGGS
jgi:hypothetical protein